MAKQPMLKFVKIDREMPQKRAADTRNKDFNEIYAEFAAEKAKEQASRCSQCGVPYCQSHCPLHNNIPDWLRMTAEGRLQEAYETSQMTAIPRPVVPIDPPLERLPFKIASSAMCHGKTTWARSLSRSLPATVTPRPSSMSISPITLAGSSTTPPVTTQVTPSRRMPLGIRESFQVSPPETTVWPAFAPPW